MRSIPPTVGTTSAPPGAIRLRSIGRDGYPGGDVRAELGRDALSFDRVGNGFLIAGGALLHFAVPAAGSDSATPIDATAFITGLPAATGFAFGTDGYLYLTVPTASPGSIRPRRGAGRHRRRHRSPPTSPMRPAAPTRTSSPPRRPAPKGPFAPGDQFSADHRGGGIARRQLRPGRW